MQHAPVNQNLNPYLRGNNFNNKVDPYGKVTSKARKVIENVERQRTTNDPRIGSTGGSFDDEIETTKQHHIMNNTLQDFYNLNDTGEDKGL